MTETSSEIENEQQQGRRCYYSLLENEFVTLEDSQKKEKRLFRMTDNNVWFAVDELQHFFEITKNFINPLTLRELTSTELAEFDEIAGSAFAKTPVHEYARQKAAIKENEELFFYHKNEMMKALVDIYCKFYYTHEVEILRSMTERMMESTNWKMYYCAEEDILEILEHRMHILNNARAYNSHYCRRYVVLSYMREIRDDITKHLYDMRNYLRQARYFSESEDENETKIVLFFTKDIATEVLKMQDSFCYDAYKCAKQNIPGDLFLESRGKKKEKQDSIRAHFESKFYNSIFMTAVLHLCGVQNN